jgi:hypothetical protein
MRRMEDSSSITLRPTIRSFLLWSALGVGSIVGICAVYHAVWPLSHPIPHGRVVEYIEFSSLTCFLLGLFMLLAVVAPSAISFALQRAFWEAHLQGVALYRDGVLRREVPWAEIARVTVFPKGVRLQLRRKSEPERLKWVPWCEARCFARYCNEQIRQGSQTMPTVDPGTL